MYVEKMAEVVLLNVLWVGFSASPDELTDSKILSEKTCCLADLKRGTT